MKESTIKKAYSETALKSWEKRKEKSTPESRSEMMKKVAQARWSNKIDKAK